jgi:Leucine-rich repeat (LRR) protein
MKTVKYLSLFACGLAFTLLFCAKDSGTNTPVIQTPTVFDWSDTLVLRAMLDSNGLSNVSAGSTAIVTTTLDPATNFHRIRELNLSGRGIHMVPASIGAFNFLYILKLDTNNITVLPPEIGRCTSLVAIHLSNNQLSTVPAELSSLTHLTTLVLSHNSITSLPQSLWNITSLGQLYLDYNQLTSISTEVSNLTHLTRLSMNNNALATLPQSLSNLSLLDMIEISNNAICYKALPSTFQGWLDLRSEQGWEATQVQTACP